MEGEYQLPPTKQTYSMFSHAVLVLIQVRQQVNFIKNVVNNILFIKINDGTYLSNGGECDTGARLLSKCLCIIQIL